MHTPRAAMSDPFALMTDPQSVVAAMEASERLRALRSRVCRPLDKVGFGRGEAEADDEAKEPGAWQEDGEAPAEPDSAA